MELLIGDCNVIIDDEDYAKISMYKWYVVSSPRGYSKRISTMKPTYYIHRVIMDAPKGMDVDHINGDSLDNRKCNLRICSHCNNTKNTTKRVDNTTGYKGVSYAKWAHKYRAEIQADGKRKKLGYFNTAEEAWLAYCDASRCLHGEFSNIGQ